jgi:hypothetical protein
MPDPSGGKAPRTVTSFRDFSIGALQTLVSPTQEEIVQLRTAIYVKVRPEEALDARRWLFGFVVGSGRRGLRRFRRKLAQ